MQCLGRQQKPDVVYGGEFGDTICLSLFAITTLLGKLQQELT